MIMMKTLSDCVWGIVSEDCREAWQPSLPQGNQEPLVIKTRMEDPRLKVKVHKLDIVALRIESPPQKRSGMACVLKKGFHSVTCTPTRSSAVGMSHTCLCLPSHSWCSFTDPGGMEG